MAALALVAVIVALVAAAVRLPPQRSLAVVVGTIVLVPGTLPAPGGPGVLTVHRLVLGAALLGLALRCRRRELPWSALAPPALAYRLAVVLGVLAVIGVGLLQPPTDPSAASRSWQALAAQLLVLVTVVALARAARQDGAGVVPLAIVTTVGALIAVVEHITGQSYARLWFHAVPRLLAEVPAEPLATRGGDVRVRVAGDFTLGYAWTTAAVLPLLVVAASRSTGWLRRGLLAAIPVVLLAVAWTYSRSAALPALIAVVLTLVLLRDRGLRIGGAAVLLVAGVVVLSDPSLLDNFRTAADQGSIDVRLERLPLVTALASAHPYTGIGLSGLAARGFPATDSTFLLGYAEVGAIGLAALCGLLLAGSGAAFRGVLAVRRDDRAIPYAAGLGAILLILGALSFDAFTTATSSEMFWVLVGFGVVAAERSEPVRRLVLPLRTVGAALVGLAAVGVVVRVVATPHVAQTWQFDTLRPFLATTVAPEFTGVQLRTTACDVVQADLALQSDTDVTCQSLGDGPGQGLLRLQARDAHALTQLRDREVGLIREVPTLDRFALRETGPAREGIPSALRTAPVSLPVFAAVWLIPLWRRRE